MNSASAPRPTRSTRSATMFALAGRSNVMPSSSSRSPRLKASLMTPFEASSSAIAEAESLPPSYTPTTMQPARCSTTLPLCMANFMQRSGRRSVCSVRAGLRDAAREDAKDFPVQRSAEHLILVAGVDVGVDVDFDEIHAVLDLLQVDAVQAPADQAGGSHGRIDDLLGHLADGHCLGLALDQLFLALDHLVHLPVAGRHEVL